jgi:hypothetical protein
MMLLPLDQIRLDARSHVSALQWIGLLYRQPKRAKETGRSFPPEHWVANVLWIYLHAVPYLLIFSVLARWFLFEVLGLEENEILIARSEVLLFHGIDLAIGLARGIIFGLIFGLIVCRRHFNEDRPVLADLDMGGGLVVGFACALAFGFAFAVTLGLASMPALLFLNCLALGLIFRVTFRSAGVGFFWGSICIFLQAFADDAGDRLTVCGLAFVLSFFRLYYFPFHFLWVWPRAAALYRFHPVAWDTLCLFSFPGLDRILVRYAARDPKAGEREINRLIDEYPSQREAALRARALLVARRAAVTMDLARLDETLASLPTGKRGFLKETSEVRRHVHEITAYQARLDILERPFLREPYASLLVKEIETFEQQMAGFKPPLSTELRKAARQWLVIARRQRDAARAAVTREPTHQVFRAGDPVNREREAFVLRAAILGEIDRQVMLATGCPGLLVYGRRRMGKSTLLRNLGGLLPPRVLVMNLSMQEARAFTSLSDLVALIAQRVAAVLPEPGELPADLKGFERFLNATQRRLDSDDRRLLVGVDEYENLDSKIGEGALSEDLLAVIRESIQTHRRLIWAFAGSHGIDELVHAPWSSYLVSARTIEVSPFEPAETRLLLTEPLKHSSLWRASGAEPPRFEPGFWGEGGIERIHAEAGGWPHLVQLIAETAVDLVNDAGVASVDAALLERALDRAVIRGNNVFLELLERESRLPGEWDYLRGFRKVEEQPIPDNEALDRSLRRRRLVIEEDGRYRLRVPLMGRWLRQRI